MLEANYVLIVRNCSNEYLRSIPYAYKADALQDLASKVSDGYIVTMVKGNIYDINEAEGINMKG